MDRNKLEIGQSVIFVDEHREEHVALVTNVWQSSGGLPGCNVVYVSDDESKSDPYGRQVERKTSIVHQSVQPAGGMCWRHVGETIES